MSKYGSPGREPGLGLAAYAEGLEKWLATHIQVRSVTVTDPAEYGDGALLISIEYTLLETQTAERTEVRIL